MVIMMIVELIKLNSAASSGDGDNDVREDDDGCDYNDDCDDDYDDVNDDAGVIAASSVKNDVDHEDVEVNYNGSVFNDEIDDDDKGDKDAYIFSDVNSALDTAMVHFH